MRIWSQYAMWLMVAVAPLFAAETMFAAETIDRIVATVNGTPVMESELIEQLRFEQFLAGKPAEAVPVAEERAALERLLDQMLLAQQMDSANFDVPRAEEVNQKIQEMRQQVSPAPGAWQKSLQQYGLTESDLAAHIGLQLRTLHFIDARFRPAVRVDAADVEIYYREQLAPKMKQAGAELAPLQQVEPRIREILMQQQMDDLLENWLKTLRARTDIRLPVPSGAVGSTAPSTAQAQAAEVH